MKKNLLLFMLMFSIGFFLQASPEEGGESGGFSLKVSGGIGNTMGGDMPKFIGGLNNEVADLSTLMGIPTPDKILNTNLGPEFDVELLYRISKRFDIGFGAGYLIRNRSSNTQIKPDDTQSISFLWEPSYRIIPILLSGHYHVPISSKSDLVLKAGGGYYFVTSEFKVYQEETSQGGIFWEETIGTAAKNGIGFHGGLGLSYLLSKNISLIFELSGRYLEMKDMDVEAEETYSTGESFKETGTFWYHDEYEPATNQVYESLIVSEEKPNLPRSTGIRKAVIGLSGIAIKIGLKINLG